ncbi:Lrp/AsnC family transcriptional regulator [Noviherbaspirillum sp. CPCC 100848]|uniref:Lrp/AsnC family transcriptional regulator n=1 Tax=Noviherbaspirillum album TaxID=3080276 RepID=A0ABU6JB08_9BURK|nr:Lrp/AsnC family transcriptional regulator [Noviherbaspirillum sp. CPCC 100848]MEC4720818.1 Lrp/AsnC family transcriptional regulator [Noviherbaspirillum sp. CPCC 100848]
MTAELDAYDRKILSELQKDATVSQNELGARVNLSAAAVNRRIRRLTEVGAIMQCTAVVAPAAVGYGLSIIVNVEVESEQIDLLDRMKRTFAKCPQVQQCYYVAGEWDFVLVLAVKDMEQYNSLTRTLFFGDNNVKRFKTLVAMDRVKVGLALPIE